MVLPFLHQIVLHMTYKTVIIDDSSVQRLATTFLVKNHPRLEFIGAYANPYEGIQAIYEKKADILLLDVLIDDINAFELLDSIEIPSTILINSTWEKYASLASSYGINDFLLKPIPKKEFDTKINEITDRLQQLKAYYEIP